MGVGGAPNTPPNGPAPSNPQSSPSLVGFDPKQAVPQQPIYFQRNDYFGFITLSNLAQCNVHISYRWLTPQGELKEGQLDTGIFNGNNITLMPLYEGWLISFALRQTVSPPSGGWTFTQALVFRNPLSPSLPGNPHALFWQGFVPFTTSNGWPGTPAKEITDGAGVLRSITGTTPAAGAEISEIAPIQRRWNLLALTATLVTSATVANRDPVFLIDDGVNTLYKGVGIVAQPAGGTVGYSLSPVIASQAFLSGNNPCPFPIPFPMKASFRIKSNTLGLQAGDQWSAPQYLVQEWGTWDS